MDRLMALREASEFVLAQINPEGSKKTSFKSLFIGKVRRLKAAYDICQPAGRLNTDENAWAQLFMSVRSLIIKMTDSGLSVETMNKEVEAMVSGAIRCTGVETLLNAQSAEDIFGDAIMEELEHVKEPNTRFQLLVKLLKKAIKEYGTVNKIKEQEFLTLLAQVVDDYNHRDDLQFANEVAEDTVNAIGEVVEKKVNSCIDRLKELFAQLKKDRVEFRDLGITFEEKAFYDILVAVRDEHGFEYSQDKCIDLAHKINEVIAQKSLDADWLNNKNIRASLDIALLELLYNNGYPPEWSEDVFTKVMAQVENFKKHQ